MKIESRMFGIFFVASLLVFFYQNSFLPTLFINPFAFLIPLSLLRFSTTKTLLISFWCGLFVDLFQSQLPFTFFQTIFPATAIILYKQKGLLIEDKLYTLPLFSYAFSFINLFSINLFFLLKNLPCVPVATLAFSCLIDSLFSFVIYSLPKTIYEYLKKSGFRFDFMRRLN